MDAIPSTIDTRGIAKLVGSRAPDSSLRHPARALLGKYAAIAAAGEWPLAPADRIDADALGRSLERALAAPVNAVRLVSLSMPYGDLEWTTDASLATLLDVGFAPALEESLDEDPAWSFGGRLAVALDHRLLRGLGEGRMEILDRDVRTKLMPGVRQALFCTLVGQVRADFAKYLCDAVEETLRDFLCCTVLDDRGDGVPLGHLVRMLASTIPLGMKRGEPGTWLALAA